MWKWVAWYQEIFNLVMFLEEAYFEQLCILIYSPVRFVQL